MAIVLNGSVTHPIINEKIDALVECDKIYVRFMESRLKIQEEQLEFLHRLHNFHNQFSINRTLYIRYPLFQEECEEISDKISKVEKQLEIYQKKFEESFTRMIKNSIRRSATLQQLKEMIVINNLSDSDPETESTLTSSVTLMHTPTNKALLSEKENLEEDWAIFSEYADQEIMECHSQFYVLCKEFSI